MVSPKLTDQYVLEHPRGLAYHLSAWEQAVEGSYGFKCYRLTAFTGNRISGVLPLVRIRLPMMPGTLVSLPYCDAAGPLADTPQIEHQLISDALHLARTMGIKNLSIRSSAPMAGISPETTRHPGKVRMLLPLPDSAEKLLSSLKAKVRSQVKKPFKDGLVVKSGGLSLVDDFYPLFAENMRDLGSPVHARAWIRQILRCFGNRAVLFIVKLPDQTPAAGGILLCHPNMVSVPWASSLRRFNRWNPNMMLYWSFLKYAADNHYPIFDFGRSTPGEGTYSFKKQWGAVPSPLHWADFNTLDSLEEPAVQPVPSLSALSSDCAKRKLAESVIMKMPVSISRMVGILVRKYIPL
jgi:FemAB-related protein (PEP-CTERM system-associated)